MSSFMKITTKDRFYQEHTAANPISETQIKILFVRINQKQLTKARHTR